MKLDTLQILHCATHFNRADDEVGLHDEDAGNDVRDLRSLITDWRGMKKVVWQTVARAGTMFVLGLLMLGAWAKLGGGGGGPE